jgi:cytoskeletal protein RodZ
MFGGILQDVIAGLFFIVCFLVVVGLLVVLVRFLLVATKAAEIYVAKNSSTQPVGSTTPAAEPTVVTTPVVTTPVKTTPVKTTPVTTTPTTTRTRTPKPPTP